MTSENPGQATRVRDEESITASDHSDSTRTRRHTPRPTRRNINWQKHVLPHAANIVNSYDTGVTLRQLFYRLVADGTLPNLQNKYRSLSSVTAKARREDGFPELLDRQSRIERYTSFDSTTDAMEYLADTLYRRDRTEGQEWSIYLGVEKAGLSAQLDSWFGDTLGLPILALGGYASQSLCHQITKDILRQHRPAALIYAGDHDPTGENIDRDIENRVPWFQKVIRVGLNADQVRDYNLPFNSDPAVMAKLEDDPRAAKFQDRHGYLEQYEVDALDPDTLRDLYQSAIDDFWDEDAHTAVMDREAEDLDTLRGLAGAA